MLTRFCCKHASALTRDWRRGRPVRGMLERIHQSSELVVCRRTRCRGDCPRGGFSRAGRPAAAGHLPVRVPARRGDGRGATPGPAVRAHTPSAGAAEGGAVAPRSVAWWGWQGQHGAAWGGTGRALSKAAAGDPFRRRLGPACRRRRAAARVARPAQSDYLLLLSHGLRVLWGQRSRRRSRVAA